MFQLHPRIYRIHRTNLANNGSVSRTDQLSGIYLNFKGRNLLYRRSTYGDNEHEGLFGLGLETAFGKHLEKIHVTWTLFAKKRDKITTLHEDDQDMAYNA
uniref:Uncharacterized protein n=1 Tax=Tanacetum cinerariifolium TaxID=118510 RepID=A0A6L2KMX8_TANCI|nr:hypothetical protein [Tanacetum cinerariifolium]